jgi:hypothetical protein
MLLRAAKQDVHPIDPHAPETTASFRDPAGNLLGIYQHRRR